MKIAQIPPLYESDPPKFYGGTERVVASLCDALVDLGHEVTLFAAADAQTSARLVRVRDQSIRLDAAPRKSDLAAHMLMLDEVKRRADDFDILHFHVELLHLSMFERHAARTVTTQHGRLDVKDLDRAYERWSSFGLVSISDRQRQPLPKANWIGTVHNGLPRAQYAVPEHPTADYFAFLGRVSPEKGCDEAIRIAKRAGVPLRIAAKIDDSDFGYFKKVVEPMLDDPLVEFIGEIGEADKQTFLGNASALLFPIQWPEPFGLVMIEAMSCGTPVIAYPHGAVPEVIEDGVSGFIVDSEQEALRAVRQAVQLDRRAIRAAFERRFTAESMARAYVDVYSRISTQAGA